MAPKVDTQGWIDVTDNGREFAYFVRDGMLWVRYRGKYKCTQVGGSATIGAARALAALITTEADHWIDEARAKKAGLPSE